MRAWLTIVAAVGLIALSAGSAAAGELRSFKLPSPLVDPASPGGTLAEGRGVPEVNVLLPDGYDRDSQRGYPVLWLLHGANGGTDSWTEGGMKSIEQLAAGLRAIAVMPDGGPFGMYMDWWNDGARGNPAWATYHLNVLRRAIERRYPIRPGRRWHAIAGISMGGQGTLRYASMLPGYFGSAVAFSAALPDMQSADAQFGISLFLAGAEGVTYSAVFGPPTGAYAEGNSPRALVPNLSHTRLYLTSGNGTNCASDPMTGSYAADVVTESFISAQQAPYAAAARAAGADVTAVVTCGVHTFGVWNRAFPQARRWGFFRPVPKGPRNWTYRTVAADGEMWGLRFRFAEPPGAVVEFRRSGPRLSAAGTGTIRISGPKGCGFGATLPFDLPLPRACR